MNIGNNVADRCYTPYRTNQKVGYFKGFTQTADGMVMAEQSNSADGGFIKKFVDYQEFHKEWMSQPNTDYYFGHAYDVSGMKKMAAEATKAMAASESGKTVDNSFYKITKGENDTIEIYDKTTGISYRFEEEYLSVQTDEKTGVQFLISDIPHTTMNVEAMKLTPQLKASMEQYLNGKEITEKTLDPKFTLYRDNATGIESLHWRSGDGFGSCMMISTKEQMQRYEELTNTYLTNYPNLVSNREHAQIRASWEIRGYARRTPGGIITISPNAISYDDNNDYGSNPPDFSHCWSYSFDEKMHQDGYEDFVFGLREYLLSADLESLGNKDDFLDGFSEYQKEIRAEEQEEMKEKVTENVAKKTANAAAKAAEQAFYNVAPNAPEEVKKAWMEAAQETGANGMGMMENGMMSHISQLFVMKVVKKARGEEDWSDVLGNSVGSALAAVKQALYQLENPLTPHSERGANAQKAIAKEKEFYLSFIEKLEAVQETEGSGSNAENPSEDMAEDLDYAQAVRAKIEELYEKIKNGDTEQKFSIGAEEYTIKEWDKLLARFDAVQEEIRKAQAEEIENRTEENQQAEELTMTEAELLTAQTTVCSYPAEKPEEETVRYITCYTGKGIFCRKAGQTEGYVWSYLFKNEEEYEKVMDFLDKLPADWNLRFTAHENFWKDFLNGSIDEKEFLDFLEGTNKGVPDYTLVKGDSVYVDTEKIKWAPYFNPLGSRFYTAEEFQKQQRELIEANAAKLPKLMESFEEKFA